MPPRPVPFVPRPYVGQTYEPRLRLGDYARQRGDMEAEAILRGAAIKAQLLSGIGQNISGTLRDIAMYPEQQRQRAIEEATKIEAMRRADEELQLRKAGLAARMADREQASQERATLQARANANELGGDLTPGPISQEQMDTLQGSPRQAARTRYVFGPGTADGPELQPTDDQRRLAEVEGVVKGMGGIVGPNGQIVMPPKPDSVSYQRETAIVNGRPTIVNFNPKTGEYTDLQGNAVQPTPIPPREPSQGPRPLTQTAEAQIIQRLSNQWIAANKPMKELDRQVELMDAGMRAVERGDRAQGDQTILVTFQKILDPPSVVRESEYMRSAAGQSLMNRVQGAMQQLQTGGAKMKPEELKKFAALARDAAAAQRKAANMDGMRKRLGLTADRYNIPHELIFDAEPGSAPPPAPGAAPNYLSTDPNFGTPVAPVKPKGGR